jgi:hypothetical protein
MTPQLKLTKRPNRTAEAKALAEIHREWEAWHGPNGEPWRPYAGSTEPWSEKVSASLRKGTYRVIVDAPVPRWRRILRKIWG